MTTSRTRLRHSGRSCLCRACGAYFLGVSAFDKHRDGPWTDRACLTAPQMAERGFKQNPHGYWSPPARSVS